MVRLLQFLFFLHAVHAVTTIHYYRNPSCNTGTDVGGYDAPTTPTASDTSCHTIHNQTRALYINGLDPGCGVLTYPDTACTPSSANDHLGVKGDCYYLSTHAVIGSWLAVCGTNLTAASSSIGAAAATRGVSSTTETASATATVSETAGGASGTAQSAAGGGRVEMSFIAGLWGFAIVGVLVGATGLDFGL